jgi:hypothetical protein
VSAVAVAPPNQVLADSLNIRCKLQKGLSFTGDEEGAHALLTRGLQEYVLDLVEVPGRCLPTKEGQPTIWPKAVPAGKLDSFIRKPA